MGTYYSQLCLVHVANTSTKLSGYERIAHYQDTFDSCADKLYHYGIDLDGGL